MNSPNYTELLRKKPKGYYRTVKIGEKQETPERKKLQNVLVWEKMFQSAGNNKMIPIIKGVEPYKLEKTGKASYSPIYTILMDEFYKSYGTIYYLYGTGWKRKDRMV